MQFLNLLCAIVPYLKSFSVSFQWARFPVLSGPSFGFLTFRSWLYDVIVRRASGYSKDDLGRQFFQLLFDR